MSATSMILRVRSAAQANIKDINFLTPSTTFEDLHQVLSSVTEIPEDRLKVLSGFPPKPLRGDRASELKDIGIRNGDLLIVEKRAAADPPQYSTAAPVPEDIYQSSQIVNTILPSSPAAYCGAGVDHQENSTKATSNSPMISPSQTSIPIKDVCAKPESKHDFSNATELKQSPLPSIASISSSKSASNSTFCNETQSSHVPEVAIRREDSSAKSTKRSASGAIKAESSTPGVFLAHGSPMGILLKREVPSDNSCLFASIDYVLNGKINSERSQQLRQLVADELQLQIDLIPDYVLDKPRQQYSVWILRPQSWGGEVELALLSNYFRIEIVAVDARSGRVNRFGESKKFTVRVFLLYDGIHYDPLHMESPTSEGYFYTSFASSEDGVLGQAIDLAGQAYSSGSFTDTEKFTLQCGNCGKRLRGQVEAQQHARATAHTDFQEVKES